MLWTHEEKNADHTDAGVPPAATCRSRSIASHVVPSCSRLEQALAYRSRAAAAAATEHCFYVLRDGVATTKRLRQQPAVRRERLVAAAGESRRLKPGASPKDWRRRLRLRGLCSFPHAFKALAKNQHQTHGVCYLRFFKICLELLETHSYSI